MRPRGFRNCVIPLHREHEAAAREAIAKTPCVDPGSIRFDGSAVHYAIDLSCGVPDGDAPAIELVIRRDVEKAVRP